MNILIEKNIMVPMRDGVRLATDVYRSAEGGPAPVLFSRLPYCMGQQAARRARKNTRLRDDISDSIFIPFFERQQANLLGREGVITPEP